jgi:hypothetical protein
MLDQKICLACTHIRYDEDGYLKDLDEMEYTCPHCNNEGWLDVSEDDMVFVNVYKVTRHYGGAEEGGWYYNWYTCIETFPVKNKNAHTVKEELESEHAHHKYGNIYSVLGGQDIAVMIEATPKESETTERPYYC